MRPEHSATAAAGGIAGAATTVIVWLVQLLAHVTVPDNVAIAMTAIMAALFGFLTHEWQSATKKRLLAAKDAINALEARTGTGTYEESGHAP